MYIHKEGRKLLLWLGVTELVLIVAMLLVSRTLSLCHYIIIALLVIVWFFFAWFFRMPKRKMVTNGSALIAPADGKICALEKVFEKEYLNAECMQISIFMFGTDVHVNRYPVNGTVEYVNYHKGEYFVASHPKSSTLNERSSIGMLMSNGQRLLVRQVAGFMARRVVCYAKPNEHVKQNDELGFIKFGSRVDLFVPLNMKIKVSLGDVVRNGITPLCTFDNANE